VRAGRRHRTRRPCRRRTCGSTAGSLPGHARVSSAASEEADVAGLGGEARGGPAAWTIRPKRAFGLAKFPISWKEQRMKSRIVLACLAAATCLVLGFVLTRPNQAGPDVKAANAEGDKAASEDEAAIRKAVADYSAAFAKADVDAVLATWMPDAEFI